MRKKLRLFGGLFAILTILSCSLFAFAVDYTLTTDTTITVEGSYAYISFTPDITGTYKVTFKGNDSFEVYYDKYYDSNDDYYFEIIDNFEADEYYDFDLNREYYYGVIEPIYVEVSVTLLCEHKNTTTIPAVDFTCTQDGSSEKIICTDCDWVLLDSFATPARHLDADNDYVCDVCSEEALLISEQYDGVDYDYVTDTEIPYTTKYKLYANGDLYIDGSNANFSSYYAKEFYELFKRLRNPYTYDYALQIRNIYVSKDVAYVGFDKDYGGEKFIVDPENKEYSSDIYGVLFSKDGKEILDVPALWKETSYDIPYGVEKINTSTFTRAEYLKTVTIPSSVKYISYYAFNTEILTCDETVDGLTYIGDALIEVADEDLTVLKIREGTRIIAYDVGSYDAVYEFPASLESISGKLNYDASAFFVDENNSLFSDIDGVLFNKDKSVLINYPGGREDDKYVVPAGVKEIAEEAFYYSDIKYVELPDGLEKIGAYAFYITNLQDIDIPLRVKEIGNYAFCTEDSIKAVVVHKNIEKIGYNTFDCNTLVILNPECEIDHVSYYTRLIIGYNGSTAEKFADENGIPFATLGDINGENHKHIYIPKTIIPATCTTDGEESFTCPCGNTETYTRVIEATGHDWWDGGDMEYCENCDETRVNEDNNTDEDDNTDVYYCECKCHEDTNKLEMFFFKIKVFFWKLFRTNRYCDCGAYHW